MWQEGALLTLGFNGVALELAEPPAGARAVESSTISLAADASFTVELGPAVSRETAGAVAFVVQGPQIPILSAFSCSPPSQTLEHAAPAAAAAAAPEPALGTAASHIAPHSDELHIAQSGHAGPAGAAGAPLEPSPSPQAAAGANSRRRQPPPPPPPAPASSAGVVVLVGVLVAAAIVVACCVVIRRTQAIATDVAVAEEDADEDANGGDDGDGGPKRATRSKPRRATRTEERTRLADDDGALESLELKRI